MVALIAVFALAVVEISAEPAVQARLADHAQAREEQTPQALGVFREIAKWWPIIKAAGIKGE